MAKVLILLSQGINIKDIGMRINEMELEFIFGKTDPNIMDSGNIQKWMDKEHFILLTAPLFKVNLKMINTLCHDIIKDLK